MPPTYHFVTTWTFAAPPAAIYDVLADPLDLPRWWPSVYLDVRETRAAPAPGALGAEYALLTRGWLPYRLRWTLTTTGAERPGRLALAARGDFEGRGEWTIESRGGGGTTVTFEWRVAAHKPLLRLLSPVLRPLFAWNHAWAMRQGRTSLARELARRAREARDAG